MGRKQSLGRPRSFAYRKSHQFLGHRRPSSFDGGRIAEVAGGATAECAAVACCCPAAVVNLLVVVVCKIPSGICRKAVREHKRRRLMRKGLLPFRSAKSFGSWEEGDYFSASDMEELTLVVVEAPEMDDEYLELEKEMWKRFDNGGFWRSVSQREG